MDVQQLFGHPDSPSGNMGTADSEHIPAHNNEDHTSSESKPSSNAYLESIERIRKDTLAKFKVGSVYKKAALVEEIREFARVHDFSVRLEGRNGMVCSRAANTHSKLKEQGKKELTKKESSLCSNCLYNIHWATSKELGRDHVRIDRVDATHNHDCNEGSYNVSLRKSGHSIRNSIKILTQVLAPYMVSGRPIPCNVLRWTIKPYVTSDVHLCSQTIANIIRAVKVQMDKGLHTLPKQINQDEMRLFTSYDLTSETCGIVLKELITNSDGNTTWIVTRLMHRLAEQDEYFDYRMHFDDQGQCDLVNWQVGHSRGLLQTYHSHLFADARKSENMNTINMRYLSLVGIDANHGIFPASESFVFEEELKYYELVVAYTIDMTPGVTADMVSFGSSDFFIPRASAEEWFPNVIWWCDPYHFCSPKNKDSVLAKDFGPNIWTKVKEHFNSAVHAQKEEQCLEHLGHAIKAVGANQNAINKIVKWQEARKDWALFVRNTRQGHLGVKGSTHAEMNHSSLRAIAGDDPSRPIETNISDVMQRTGLLIQTKQKNKDTWATQAAGDIDRIKDPRAKTHLSQARQRLDMVPFQWFQEQYYLHTQYNVQPRVNEGVVGKQISHTSMSNDGYFIPDVDPSTGGPGRCPCNDMFVFQLPCRHSQAKSISDGNDPFCKEIVDDRHLFVPKVPKMKAVHSNEHMNIAGITSESSSSLTNLQSANNKTVNAIDSTVFASPSNIVQSTSRGHNMNPVSFDYRFKKKHDNVGYKKIIEASTDLAKAVSSFGNVHQNAVYTMIVGMTNVIRSGNYDAGLYKDTPMEPFVEQIRNMGGEELCVKVEGGPKLKHGVVNGPVPKNRLGGERSHVTGKSTQRSCTFCGGAGDGQPFHTNRSKCTLLNGRYGSKIEVATVRHAEIAKDMDDILAGKSSRLVLDCTFEDVSADALLATHLHISDSLPRGTRRLQISGYVKKKEGNFFLCTCINGGGVINTQSHGSETLSYHNVFIEKTVVVMNLNKLDFVFYKPIAPLSSRKRKIEQAGEDNSDSDSDEDKTISQLKVSQPVNKMTRRAKMNARTNIHDWTGRC